MTSFIAFVAQHDSTQGAAGSAAKPAVHDFTSLYKWSIEHAEQFWPAVWRYCQVLADQPTGAYLSDSDEVRYALLQPWDQVVLGFEHMAPPDAELGPRWFLGAKLNYAENLLRWSADPQSAHQQALVFWNERGRQSSISFAELSTQVAQLASAMRAAGVQCGDRVAGFMPNLPATVIAMLAAASLGAIWSSCSPDFGINGVLDRFGQIQPKLLFCADGYVYNGQRIDSLARVAQIAAALPTLQQVVVVPYLDQHPQHTQIVKSVLWDDFLSHAGSDSTPDFTRLGFDHPIFIMYSSGTTGLPKCMVHGAGGTLLQHLKELALHSDIRRGDRVFYYTTCGWMMWNWLVSSLALGATVVLYDGAALPQHAAVLWDMAEQEQLTHFGTSAKYLALAEKSGLAPASTHRLDALRTVLSTGSPLAAHSYDYVYRQVKADVCLSSISGGTDIISCFALGNPVGPVYRGQLQAPGLGMAVDVFDEQGQPLRGLAGELVCTKPFPSMPLAFWNDPDGSKYRSAYFAHFPGVWRHGDWAEITPQHGLIIYGRSDATLNPGGVRIGTAEIYRAVEQLPEVLESVAVGQEWKDDVRIVLFVKLRDGLQLNDEMRARISQRIRELASPHHLPKLMYQVADIPRTISGKISELAVREAFHGRSVANLEALANPEALLEYRQLAAVDHIPPGA